MNKQEEYDKLVDRADFLRIKQKFITIEVAHEWVKDRK